MPRGTVLTPSERERILAFKECGLSNRAIAKKLKRSPKVVNNFVKNPKAYNTAKRPGRKPKLSPRDLRRLITAASKGIFTARQLRFDQQVPLGVRRIQQILSSVQHLRWEMRQKMPWMTKDHMIRREMFAAKHLESSFDWSSVIFSDEKKFNLDGPDGIQYYWRDLRKEPQYFQKRQSGGGSVMVWGAYAADGTKVLAFLDGKQDSIKYCMTLRQHLLPIYCRSHQTFQQDNASIHSSKATTAFLRMEKVKVMTWPARSPDLNPIENVWGFLVRKIYANGRCYPSVASLRTAIEKAWSKLTNKYLKALSDSMNKRCVEVLKKRGRAIDY